MEGVQFWVSDLPLICLIELSLSVAFKKVFMSNGCSNACKLSPMDSINNVGAIGIHVMDSVGVRYVNTCSNDLLVVMMDAAPICVSDLLPARYFEGQVKVLFVSCLCSCHLTGVQWCVVVVALSD